MNSALQIKWTDEKSFGRKGNLLKNANQQQELRTIGRRTPEDLSQKWLSI